MKSCYIIVLIFITNSNSQNTRSIRLSSMKSSQFQCYHPSCQPFNVTTVSNARYCQMSCLSQEYCSIANFYSTSKICEIFFSMPSNYGGFVNSQGVTGYMTIFGTRIPPAPITTTTTTTSTITTTTSTSSTSTTTIITAPTNLVNYRNDVGQYFTFTIIGSNAGSVWGTGIYTDDSSLATAAVHAGFAYNGQVVTVTVQMLPGQSSYTGSSQNGVISSSYGSWPASYMFISSSG